MTEPAVTAFPHEGVENMFKEGKLGMIIEAPAFSKQIRQERASLDYGVALVPAGPTGARGTHGETDLIVMFKNSRSKDEAWKFLDYLYTTAMRTRFTQDEGFLPVTKEETQMEHYVNDPELKTFVALLPVARFTPPISGWEILAQRTTEALQKIYLGSDVEATLNAVAEEINRILLK